MDSVGTGYYMSGSEIDGLSEDELRRVVPTISIFYRTTPKHKMAIVKALQANDLVVAMTGDGGKLKIKKKKIEKNNINNY